MDKPKMTIVAAQTGSGKSNLTAKLLRENNNCIFVDSDKYKHFRYDAQEIASKEQVLYPFLTGPDAYDHADNIYQYAREHRYNIIKESAPSMTKGLFGKDSEDLLKNGYQIQVHVLAVGKLNSALSVHERYELQIIHGLKTAKLTDRKRHDESYEALEENIRQIQDRFEVQVYTRGRKENNFEPIRIYPDKKYASAVDAIAAARKEDNQITVSELGERYQLIQRQMDARNAPKEQKEQLINLCEGEKMRSEEINLALEIVNDRISQLMNVFSVEKDQAKSKEFAEKIDVLQKVREQVYLGNQEIIEKVILKKEEGIL